VSTQVFASEHNLEHAQKLKHPSLFGEKLEAPQDLHVAALNGRKQPELDVLFEAMDYDEDNNQANFGSRFLFEKQYCLVFRLL
jgi:hypothetical protein